jgi:MoaA/NifB/PqqE/SkfB family radical SAM enzyme
MSALLQFTAGAFLQGPITLDIDSIDVYLTYRCGLRCSHCFMGENLSSNRDMDLDSIIRLLKTARSWNTKQITFLGGEPTMHPDFLDVLAAAASEGYSTRIVTNGHISYSRFLDRCSKARPFISFSVDGATAAVHDWVRGRGAYNLLLNNIERTRALGYPFGGIFSVSRENVDDAERVLELSDALGFEYLNVHYVTNRGFAPSDIVLTPDEWARAYRAMRAAAARLTRTEIRIERTFYEAGSSVRFRCAVKERTNLMVLPDGRVFMCMLFIDSPGAHSFVWTGRELVRNLSASSEQGMVRIGPNPGCRGMHLVNSDVEDAAIRSGEVVHCMYEKERMPPGRPSAISAPDP